MTKHSEKKVKHLFSRWKMGDFLRNFAAVVLGIVITFVGSDLISSGKTRQELRKAMQLVKSELQNNRETVQKILEREIREQKAAGYLLRYKGKIQEASEDSLQLYAFQPFQIGSYTYTNDALEMLKMSSLIQQIKNKELALQVIRSYDAIKSADQIFESFLATKKIMQEKIMAQSDINDLLANQTHSPVEMWQVRMYCRNRTPSVCLNNTS